MSISSCHGFLWNDSISEGKLLPEPNKRVDYRVNKLQEQEEEGVVKTAGRLIGSCWS